MLHAKIIFHLCIYDMIGFKPCLLISRSFWIWGGDLRLGFSGMGGGIT